MRRFFCKALTDTPVLPPETTHHLKRVLRIEKGDTFILFNDENWCEARLVAYEKGCALCQRIGELYLSKTQETTPLHLFCSLPKQQRLSTMIEKIAEIGCDSFTPLYTARTAVKLHPDKIEDRLQRWERIALSATTQSKQYKTTRFFPPHKLTDLHKDPSTLSLIFSTEGNTQPLQSLLSSRDTTVPVRALIGPEGGFTPEELAHCTREGFIPVHIPLPVLRIETAAILATAFLKQQQ